MAARNFDKVQVLGKGAVIIRGSFAPQGTGAPTVTEGLGFTVARTSTGLFTITLKDAYQALVAGEAHLQLHTGASQVAQIGDVVIDNTHSTQTVQIRIWDTTANAGAGGVADVSANANNQVHFALHLRNSTVK